MGAKEQTSLLEFLLKDSAVLPWVITTKEIFKKIGHCNSDPWIKSERGQNSQSLLCFIQGSGPLAQVAPLNFFLSFTVLQFWLGATFTSLYFHFYIVHHIFVLMNVPECFIEVFFVCAKISYNIFHVFVLFAYVQLHIYTNRKRKIPQRARLEFRIA